MTYEFKYLMHLLGAASAGRAAEPPESTVDWEKIMVLAEKQQLIPLVYCALKLSPHIRCPQEIRAKYFGRVLPTVLTDCARRGSVVAMLEEMEAEGLHAVVVKGFAVAGQYAFPENRISADTDLLIDPGDEKKFYEYLQNHGFTMHERWANGHHFEARHPKMGLVEVHVQLYDEIIEDVWFKDADVSSFVSEPHQKISTGDGSYYTLGVTDHLIFLALHMIKHFILSGMSLRMMTDTALFYKNYRSELDLSRLWSILEKLHYTGLMNAILWSVIRYCGFEKEDFPGIGECPEENMECILTDLEEGGWLGKYDSMDREESWHEYNRQMILKEKSQWQYRLYMLTWQNKFSLSTIFPPRCRLAGQYPCVEKYPWMLPFIWIHRLFSRGLAWLFKKTWKRRIVESETELNQISAARVALFRRLGMM